MVDDRFEIIWGNGVANAIFGTHIVGSFCYRIFCNADSPCGSCIVEKCLKEGKSCDHEKRFFVKDRSERDFWCTVNIASRHDDGTPKNVILVLRDITERNRLFKEVMQANHLASIGELAAGVAHEINNPINSIINYAQLLINKCSIDELYDNISKSILKEGDRIASIVKSLLSFARENKVEKCIVDIREILLDSIALIKSQLKKENINLEVKLPSYCLHLFANPQQLQQVFLNIINNSRYALNQKHPLSSGKRIFKISVTKVVVNKQPYVRSVFYDNGIGISDSIKDKIFNPFFTTKPMGKGTGLGLSIIHGIIQQHQGKINFNSVEGKYTSCTVDIPMQRRAE